MSRNFPVVRTQGHAKHKQMLQQGPARHIYVVPLRRLCRATTVVMMAPTIVCTRHRHHFKHLDVANVERRQYGWHQSDVLEAPKSRETRLVLSCTYLERECFTSNFCCHRSHSFIHSFIHLFIHCTRLLPPGSGTYSPKCVSIRVLVLAAGIPTVPSKIRVRTGSGQGV